jgi:hypothetical protein
MTKFSHANSSSFIHQWHYSPLLIPGLFFSFVIFFTQTVGLPGQVISPSQGRYLPTGQHKHRINADTDIHAWGGFEPGNPAFERARTVHALVRAATVIGLPMLMLSKYHFHSLLIFCYWRMCLCTCTYKYICNVN